MHQDAAVARVGQPRSPGQLAPFEFGNQFVIRKIRLSRRKVAIMFAANMENAVEDRKSTRLNSSHSQISYAVFCLKKKKERVHIGIMEPEGCMTQPIYRHAIEHSSF